MQHLQTYFMATVIHLAMPIISVSGVWTEGPKLYKHPKLDFRFSAPGKWESYPRPEDELIHEVFDRETGIHVMLWYTATQQSARRYLSKMAGMMEVVVDEREPQRRVIDDLEAWVHSVSAEIRSEAVHTILAVIDGGADGVYLDHNALFIVQIWCPAVKHPRMGAEMEKILASVSIGGAN